MKLLKEVVVFCGAGDQKITHQVQERGLMNNAPSSVYGASHPFWATLRSYWVQSGGSDGVGIGLLGHVVESVGGEVYPRHIAMRYVFFYIEKFFLETQYQFK